jgi:hypothetical protein
MLHTSNLRSERAKFVWLDIRTTCAILEVTYSRVKQLAKSGELVFQQGQGFNLRSVLDRYQRMLRTTGAIDEQVEQTCIREFKDGLVPTEVILKHGFSFEAVTTAWQHFGVLQRDPATQQILGERDEEAAKDEATRCRVCLRGTTTAATDAQQAVRVALHEAAIMHHDKDPNRAPPASPLAPSDRSTFTMEEERALAPLDIRCSGCRMIKATINPKLMASYIVQARIAESKAR